MAAKRTYPQEAYTSGLELWWEAAVWPGTRRRLGDEARIAAWLAFNKSPGDIFTTEELRSVLVDRLASKSRNDKEHFQRRVRELRSSRDGWVFPSVKHNRNLSVGEYQLEKIGWHPARGPRPKDPTKISAKVRRSVLERDHYRCFHCGAIAGEPYPERDDVTVILTVGHIRSREHGGSGHPSNLRAECSLRNETVRSDTSPPESLEAVLTSVNSLRSGDRTTLLSWVAAGQRLRGPVDEVYDRYRRLGTEERSHFEVKLRATTRC